MVADGTLAGTRGKGAFGGQGAHKRLIVGMGARVLVWGASQLEDVARRTETAGGRVVG